MRIIALFTWLALWLLSPHEAASQPRRTLIEGSGSSIVLAVPHGRGEALRLVRARRVVWEVRAQRFEPFREGAAIPIGDGIEALGITGWTGGAYCCWTLHLFRRTPGGLDHVASLPLGKREPDIIRLAPPGGPPVRIVDAAFDFWEAPASLATDLHPTVPFHWNGRALVPDLVALRRPVSAALGTACAEMAAPEDMPPPERAIPTYPDMEAAIAALRAGDWSSPSASRRTHPGVEAARLAACLIYAGHAEEARRLLRTAWPEGAPGLAETERQLAARIACSPFVAAVRAVNGTRAPYLGDRCDRNGPGQTAVFALGWR